MEDLYRRIGAPLSLSEAGVSDIDIPTVTDLAMKSFQSRKMHIAQK
jgi:alcohol dehydrogenase class IV